MSQRYPLRDIVEQVSSKHKLVLSLDNKNEAKAKKQIENAYEAWAANDFKTARDLFQEAGKYIGSDDVPQYKLDIVIGIVSEFAEYDSLFHSIVDEARDIIKQEANILQTEIYARLKSYSKQDIQYALYYAEVKKILKREKKGRTYVLNIGNTSDQ